LDGGAGNDTLLGGDGNDRLIGGDGNDLIDGNGGKDLALMGSGDDVFRWDPGDGSDTVEGQSGKDQMLFNGAKAQETVDISASHGRVIFFRDPGKITMDNNDVEDIQFNGLGGGDNVTVHNLAGTDVKHVGIDLADPTSAVRFGDGAAGNVLIEGSNASDVIAVSGTAVRGVTVGGLFATVTITDAESALDSLRVNSLGGNDVVQALALDFNVIRFTADGGSGNDVLIGSLGDDTLLGGDGNDILIGNVGTDLLVGGTGSNVRIQ
jgi:Ca2+-binding RTX toxin-like protein